MRYIKIFNILILEEIYNNQIVLPSGGARDVRPRSETIRPPIDVSKSDAESLQSYSLFSNSRIRDFYQKIIGGY